MGHDISPIANHNLNTTDIKALADDIISHIDINIEYGYYGYKEYFKLLGENKDDDYIILGKTIKDEKFKTFRLIDEQYQLKQLHQKFGDIIFYNPEYWMNGEGKIPDQKVIEEEKKELMFPDFELTLISHERSGHMVIYKELLLNYIPYYCRWWSFCRLFTESTFDNFPYIENLLEFRNDLMKYTWAFGGNKIYYLDDQSNVLEGVGQGIEKNLSWNEFEKFVADKTLPLLLNIPLFLTDRSYRNEFMERKEDPLSFVDDFSDIR